MSGLKEGSHITVKCKWCGAKNRKQVDHITVKCKECKKVTGYLTPLQRRR